MPGDPAQCRLYAARYLELSKRAKELREAPKPRRLGKAVDKTSCRVEADQPLLNALSEINFDEPFYAVPEALNLQAA